MPPRLLPPNLDLVLQLRKHHEAYQRLSSGSAEVTVSEVKLNLACQVVT
jgi:hypothetical protein